VNGSQRRRVALPVLAAAAACLLTGAGWGTDLRDVRAAMSNLTSVSADFVQTRTLRILDGPLESKGRLRFRYPGDLRWEYFSPIRQVLLMHDGSVKRYSLQDGRFSQTPGAWSEGARVVMRRIASWLRGSFEDDAVFKALLTNPKQPAIELVPRDDNLKKRIKLITIHLGDLPGVIRRIVMVERDGSTTEWKFLNTHINERIPDGVFVNPGLVQP